MIFACTDPARRYMAEGESGEYPVCPKCGGLMLNVPEEKLTGSSGRIWAFSGAGREEEDTGGRSLYCFQKATEAGNACGMTNLAIYQENGWGLKKTSPQRPGSDEQAAELGYVPAFYQLGRCFQYGLERTGIRRRPFVVISRRRKWVLTGPR
ncbi:MAG: hypothetical protein ACLR2E_03340 [Lachnospiraceae bacterium]